MKVKPKKHLGQHFLTDKNTAEKIVKSLAAEENCLVLEIGPGMGILTDFLIKRYKNLKLIELDGESIIFLKEKYPELQKQTLHEDFLKTNIFDKTDIDVNIIGNFPYNISSQILFKVLENKEKILQIVGMFQKEVAERVCAEHGSKIYGILSVLIQTYYEAEYLFTVKPGAFNPPPKVNSGVIRLTRKTETPNVDYEILRKIVKTAFNQRRKTLRNSLKGIINTEKTNSELLSKRPEQLSYNQFIELCDKIIQ